MCIFWFNLYPHIVQQKIVTTIKSIPAGEIMGKHPEVKEKLWGVEFWSDGYFVSTVSKYGNEEVIKNYVKKQGTDEGYNRYTKSNWNCSIDFQITILRYPAPWGGEVHFFLRVITTVSGYYR
jgi:hypothetical protein